METEPLGKKTIITVALLLGACVAFVGTTSTAAVVLTAHLVGGQATTESAAATKTPAAVPSARAGAKGPG